MFRRLKRLKLKEVLSLICYKVIHAVSISDLCSGFCKPGEQTMTASHIVLALYF